MYAFNEVKIVHLEITSRCNASCPMCSRNLSGGQTNPLLSMQELTLDEIKTIFPEYFIKQLNLIYLCGNFGDPIMAKDTLKALRYFRSVNSNVALKIFTNGSGRESAWWQELAKLNVIVRFGIDGLENTNAIYRRGTKWPLVINSLKSFVGAGGYAEWDYIVFRHNEHQVEDAREFAKTMGIKKFNIKSTNRFFSSVERRVVPVKKVYSVDGQYEYDIELPINENYINPDYKKTEYMHENYQSYLRNCKINCIVSNIKSLFVDHLGNAFPCCWTAGQLFSAVSNVQKESAEIWNAINSLPGGRDSISAKKNKLEDIVNGLFFQKVIPAYWAANNAAKEKLKVCSHNCGEVFSPNNQHRII